MAWDDTKQTGDLINASDWNSMVTDQKGHATRHESGGADEITHNNLSISSDDHHIRPSPGDYLSEDTNNNFDVLPANIDATLFDGSSGTDGQALVTDGTNLSFADVGSGDSGGMTQDQRQVFNDLVSAVAKNQFELNLSELRFDGGVYDIFRDMSKIALSGYGYSGATFENSISTGSDPEDVIVFDNGNRLLSLERDNAVKEYSMSTPYDFSTATATGVTLDASTEDDDIGGMAFNDDGTKFYIGGGLVGEVHEYNLSTAYDIGSASHVSSTDLSTEDTTMRAVSFNSNGTKMFVFGYDNNSLYEYNLGTAYDSSTATYSGNAYAMGGDDQYMTSARFVESGNTVLATGVDTPKVYIYDASTAYDVTSLSLSDSFSTQSGSPHGANIANEGKDLHTGGGSGNTLNNYDISQPDVTNATVSTLDSGDTDGKVTLDFQITNYSTNNNSFVAELDTSLADNSQSVGVDFNADGTKVFHCSSGFDDTVYEYNLSTAYDLTTASFVASHGFSGDDNEMADIRFNNDGTKMYLVGGQNSNVYEYSLSTAYDPSTAGSASTFDLSGQDSLPTGIDFADGGSKMYIAGNSNDSVYEYNLSTAYDVTSASYTGSSLDMSSIGIPQGLYVLEDGSRMTVGVFDTSDNGYVVDYTFGTNYDLSTVTEESQETVPEFVKGFDWNGDGSKFYIAEDDTDTIRSYQATKTYYSNGSVVSVQKDLTNDGISNPPTSVVLSQVVNIPANEDIQYVIRDANGNSVTATQSDVDTVIDISSFTSATVEIEAQLSTSDGLDTPELLEYMAHFAE